MPIRMYVKIKMDGGFRLTGDVTKETMGRSDLHAAAASGDHALLEVLLERAENVDVLDYIGQTPLFEAAATGSVKCVSLLLEKRACAFIKNDTGATPLHFAARGGSLVVVEKLLDAKAQVRATNEFGKSALCWAVYRENAACADRLLDAGANVLGLRHYPSWMKIILERRRRCKTSVATLYGVLRKRWRVPRDVIWLLSQETWKTHLCSEWDE
jgi:hypothetical protein